MEECQYADGGGHPLEKKSAKAYGGGRLFIIPGAQPLDEHFSADEREKEKGGPGDEGLDRGKGLGDRVDTEPAHKRHQWGHSDCHWA